MKTNMLSRLFVGAAILSLSFFTSCKNEEKTSTETTTTTETNNTGSTDSKETAQLNPEHGLPGHRCDIPVGAPLNSAAAMQTTPTPTTPTTSSNVSPIRVNKKPAINPPHGEPGHDCAVPVGAKLE